jgi:AcrR family transcriptional regulator
MPEPVPDGSDLRRSILDEARHLLVTDGYTNLSMRKIAGRIGYSATAIYLHFEGKDALVHALIDEGMEKLYRRLKAVVPGNHLPEDRLRAVCGAYVLFGLENPEYYEIMHLLHPERMGRYPAEKYRKARRSLDYIQDILAGGVQIGSFVVDSVAVSAAAIWSMLHGAVSLLISKRMDVRIDRTELVSAVVAHVVRSVKPPAAAPTL